MWWNGSFFALDLGKKGEEPIKAPHFRGPPCRAGARRNTGELNTPRRVFQPPPGAKGEKSPLLSPPFLGETWEAPTKQGKLPFDTI